MRETYHFELFVSVALHGLHPDGELEIGLLGRRRESDGDGQERTTRPGPRPAGFDELRSLRGGEDYRPGAEPIQGLHDPKVLHPEVFLEVLEAALEVEPVRGGSPCNRKLKEEKKKLKLMKE